MEHVKLDLTLKMICVEMKENSWTLINKKLLLVSQFLKPVITFKNFVIELSVNIWLKLIEEVLLALISNPGADDFEFHGDTPLFEKVLSKAQEWGTPDNLMFVIGATRPEILARVRELAPSSFLLVPGVGAQGGTIERVAKFGLNARCGLLVNSSRGIIYAGENEETVEAAMSKTKAAAEDLATKMSETLRK